MTKPKKDLLIEEIVSAFSKTGEFHGAPRIMGRGVYSGEKAPYPRLQSPCRVGNLQLKGRVLIAPLKLIDESPIPNEKVMRFYLARSGASLMTTGPIPASAGADPFLSRRWVSLNEKLHARGVRMLMQIRLDGKAPASAAALAATARSGAFDGVCLDARDNDEQAIEVVRQIRAKLCAFPIVYRFSLSTAVWESGLRPSGNVRPRALSEQLEQLRQLVLAGVDAFEVGLGGRDTPWLLDPAPQLPAACYAEAARAVKDQLRYLGLSAAVIAFGRLGYPDIAEEILADGCCDLVSLDGAGIKDAEWCKKLLIGEGQDVCPLPMKSYAICPGSEKIAVVGAGCRGLSYAIEAADQGHRVDLFDSLEKAGGRLAFYRSGAAYEKQNILSYLLREVGKRERICLRLGTRADAEILKKGCYDRIIFACRATAVEPPNIPGWGEVPFFTIDQLDEELIRSLRGCSVLVLGSDSLACDTAWALLGEGGVKHAALVSEKPSFMAGEPENERGWYLHQLSARGCRMLCHCRPLRIRHCALFCEDLSTGKELRVRCDRVILAEETPAPLPLYQQAVREKLAGEIELL